MTGFVFLRVRAHRLLLAAALLAVLLTTSVLATLTVFSGSIGDAGLRHSLLTRDATRATLVVRAQVPPGQEQSAATAVRKHAERTFDGLPVTVRTLDGSGPYALPRSVQEPAARSGDPDLTLFAAIDRSRVRLSSGAWPRATGSGPVEVALPEVAAKQLGLRTGARLTLDDRLHTTKKVAVRVTGVYRPADRTDPYWQLDGLGGRGMRTVDFTTYGPLLTDPAVFTAGRVTSSETSWLAAGDFRKITTSRIGALTKAARSGPEAVGADPALGGQATASTALPEVLDQAGRALLVARSTLLIVALQLVLLAAYTLLLVARLLSTERAGETELLRARGGSRQRIAALAALEALLLAVPAAVCGPLLAGPLTRLLAGQGALARVGLRLDSGATGSVWLVAAAVALGCAAAVIAPALSAGRSRRGRANVLPAPVRAGADIALLVVAGVAYWQLDRQTSGSGALGGDRQGKLGIDPLLVAAPALALLAGTVLTLRLLPPAARLAERRAAGGRGLPAALAGWQFSRRPARNAGPVLLLVLAVSMGILAVGQGASWQRSQADQADFRAGAPIRVLGSRTDPLGQAGTYSSLPGVRDVAPVSRSSMELSGNRTATVLAVDAAHAPDRLMLRGDLADEPASGLLKNITPPATARPGVLLPADTGQLALGLRLTSDGAPHGRSPAGLSTAVTAIVEDRFGLPYRLQIGDLPADGRRHTLTLDLLKAADAPEGKPAGPFALTGLETDLPQPVTGETHRLSVDGLRAVRAGGGAQPVAVPGAAHWQGVLSVAGATMPEPDEKLRPAASADGPLTVSYWTGALDDPNDEFLQTPEVTLRLTVVRPHPGQLKAVATDRFLKSAAARTGDSVDVPLGGETLKVRIVKSVRDLPTTGAGAVDGSGEALGGALLVDLRAVNDVLAVGSDGIATPTEWWLSTEPGKEARVAAALRNRPDVDPEQIVARDDIADELVGDPLGAGPQSALAAAAMVAAALAAVGFAVGAVGSLRERGQEFSLLRALGAPRRQLARLIAVEQGVLLALALLVGLVLGTVLTRAVVPLIVLTGQAAQPVPRVLVELPAGRIALLLAGIVAVPLLVVAAIALRRGDPARDMRHQGGN
ncbi:FtsX-like permease family protein [Streptomyces sp. NBC_01267]|uniref:FtsX-like permease family protein n=1 Tax=unclassified Streptomyces TaxID=2593676 RepID=UPI002E364C9B|nr:FtsX-like permease family protein [Streptomyces sp. NBC_01267]